MSYFCPCGTLELWPDETNSAKCNCGIEWIHCARENLPIRRITESEYQTAFERAKDRAGL